jgi:hypothetical protein
VAASYSCKELVEGRKAERNTNSLEAIFYSIRLSAQAQFSQYEKDSIESTYWLRASSSLVVGRCESQCWVNKPLEVMRLGLLHPGYAQI